MVTLTNHSYFNLSGKLKRDILIHTLAIKSDKFLESDQEFISTGKCIEVDDTPFGFRSKRVIKHWNRIEPSSKRTGRGRLRLLVSLRYKS
ncbi:hypothetical protein [Domibacillus sp. PGB-M46]|uniref:aldose epimerase family protein n=1 Tax=Domibacillus sp. PGB-M46 TaxID=2910255 RepID=UPI0035C8B5E4